MKYINVALILLIVITGAGVAYVATNQTRVSPTSSGTPIATAVNDQRIMASPSAGVQATPSASPSQGQKSVATFESSANITASAQTEITKKVIDPFLDYYRDQYNAGYVKTLVIQKNLNASADTYPYKADYTFEGGVNGGFLIMKQGTGVDWWYPECLNGCTFSAAFKAKYPEIVAKTQ